MTRPRQQLKHGIVLLLLLSLATSLVAPAGAWQCDTGQRCRAAAPNGSCCPEERRPMPQGAAASCCDGADKPADPARAVANSCCDTHEESANAPSLHSVRTSRVPHPVQLAATPFCRCQFALTDRAESALQADAIRLAVAPVLLPPSGQILSPPPLPNPALRPRREAPPERHHRYSPLGSRAPPARLLS
jgi:hypothetical protein